MAAPSTMASQTQLVPILNETSASGSRFTVDGRKITYKLEIIQQPERARACGSGAKSSADRRPVDPPPIVSLRIFEGANAENEITFSHNCNYALYASLENARPFAQGRTSSPQQPPSPVLTGQPISGMSLLDRPTPAGYFIFPDLSVRHEGKYRLIFSLYEAPKERKDYPTVTAENQEYARDVHLQFRAEVRSKIFTVFSAKKFPGLTESTALSRVIAEQGCRVRIRRDVRMRRRENKRGVDFDEFAEKSEYDGQRASATPDAFGHGQNMAEVVERPRSASNASNAGSYISARRPSIEPAPAYASQYASPVAPHTPHSMYPNAPLQQWQQPPPPQQMGYMHPPAPPTFASQQYQQPQGQAVSAPYNGFMAPQYHTSNPVSHARNGSIEFPAPPSGPSQHISTPVSQYPAPPVQAMSPYQPTNFSRPLVPQAQQMQPLQTHQPMQHVAYANSPAHSPGTSAEHSVPTYAPIEPAQIPQHQVSPISHMAMSTAQHGYPTNYTTAPPPKMHMAPTASGATKRTFASTFDIEHIDARLQGGARPVATAEEAKNYGWDGMGGTTDGTSPQSYFEDDAAPMLYRRADGTEKRRTVPYAR